MIIAMHAVVKLAISALLILAISELSKRSSLLGAALASIPLVSVLAMIWLWRDTHDPVRIAKFSTGVFWLVLPSLVLFVLLPPLLTRWHLSFPLALSLACGATTVAYFITAAVLKRFGVDI